MDKGKTVQHLEANLASTFLIRCQKQLTGCKQSSEVESDGVILPATAANAFYKEGWRVKQGDGQAVIFCPNCDYMEK